MKLITNGNLYLYKYAKLLTPFVTRTFATVMSAGGECDTTMDTAEKENGDMENKKQGNGGIENKTEGKEDIEHKMNSFTIDTTPYTVVEENSTKVLFPSTHDVFYNPVQQFNRDIR